MTCVAPRPNELPCRHCGQPTDGKGTYEGGFAYAWFTGAVWEFWCPACEERGKAEVEARLVRPDVLPCRTCGTPTDGQECAGRSCEEWSFWSPSCAPAQLRENQYDYLRRVTRNGPWTMTPEEWVGRGGHKMALAGPLADLYDDPAVEKWCGDVMHILMDLPRRRALAEQYGTVEEPRHTGPRAKPGPPTGTVHLPA